MIKDEIKVLGELESAYEKKKSEVFDICDSVLKKIYNLQTEYNKKNHRLFIISKGFENFKTDDVEDRGDVAFIKSLARIPLHFRKWMNFYNISFFF